MPAFPRVLGAHLVGSVNLPHADEVLRTVAGQLGDRLTQFPDGEVGERFHWILFQGAVFAATPGLVRLPLDPIIRAGFDVRPLTLDGTVAAPELTIGPLGYAAAARDSYAHFRRLRTEGALPAHARFQVSLPSPLAPVTSFIAPADREAVYPAYRDALLREIDAILTEIPAEDLAIQIDLAVEFAILEGVDLGTGPAEAWFAAEPNTDAIIAGITDLLRPVFERLPAPVRRGVHLCYGDVAEKHFIEPADTALLTGVANALVELPGGLDSVHLPVPRERDDTDYFAALSGLRLPTTTTLQLGLLHHEDGVPGAARRLAAATEALAQAGIDAVGVGTECGFGRGPSERTRELLALHAEIVDRYGSAAH